MTAPLSDELLIEELLMALQLGDRRAGRLTREVKRRGLLARALDLAAQRTREERRRLGIAAHPRRKA